MPKGMGYGGSKKMKSGMKSGMKKPGMKKKKDGKGGMMKPVQKV